MLSSWLPHQRDNNFQIRTDKAYTHCVILRKIEDRKWRNAIFAIQTRDHSFHINEEPSVLGGSTGPGYKARPFYTVQTFFHSNQNNPVNHPGPVLPTGGDGSPLKSYA